MPVIFSDRTRREADRMRAGIDAARAAGAAARLQSLQQTAQNAGLLGPPYPNLVTMIFALRRQAAILARVMTIEEAQAFLDENKAAVTAAFGAGIDELLARTAPDVAIVPRLIQGVVLTLAGIAIGAAIGGPLGAVAGGAIGLVVGIVLALIPFEAIAFVEEWERYVNGLQIVDRYIILAGMRDWFEKARLYFEAKFPDARGTNQMPPWQTKFYAKQLVILGVGGADPEAVASECAHKLIYNVNGCIPDPHIALATSLGDIKTWNVLALYGVLIYISDLGYDPNFPGHDGRQLPANSGMNSEQLVRESYGYDFVVTQRKGSQWLRPYLEAMKDAPAKFLRGYAESWDLIGGARRGELATLGKAEGTRAMDLSIVKSLPDHKWAPVTPELAILIDQRQRELAAIAAAGPIESTLP